MQIHKIMAGLLDAYTFLGNELALDMVVREADYFKAYHDHVIEVNGTAHWVTMLDNEFGGMAETLFKLYNITGDREHWRCGATFRSLPCFPAEACTPDKAVGGQEGGPLTDAQGLQLPVTHASFRNGVECSGLAKHSSSLPSTGHLSRMRTPWAASMPTHTLLR